MFSDTQLHFLTLSGSLSTPISGHFIKFQLLLQVKLDSNLQIHNGLNFTAYVRENQPNKQTKLNQTKPNK